MGNCGYIVAVLLTVLSITIPIVALSSYFSNPQNSEHMMEKLETSM